MGTFRTFEDIEAWQLARRLTKEVYLASGRGAFGREFSLRDQIRKSAVSVMSNVSEGFERDGRREFLQFLSIGKGSVGELRSQLYVALDAGLIVTAEFEALNLLAQRTASAIAGLMRHLRSTPVPGPKFRDSTSG